MKSIQEIQNRIEYLNTQLAQSVFEGKYNAAAIFKAEIKTLEWVISNA